MTTACVTGSNNSSAGNTASSPGEKLGKPPIACIPPAIQTTLDFSRHRVDLLTGLRGSPASLGTSLSPPPSTALPQSSPSASPIIPPPASSLLGRVTSLSSPGSIEGNLAIPALQPRSFNYVPKLVVPPPSLDTAEPSPRPSEGFGLTPTALPPSKSPTTAPRGSLTATPRRNSDPFAVPHLADSVQDLATSCESSNKAGWCLGNCVVRPLWGIFRIATHCLGSTASSLSGLSCGCASLACRTISPCSDCAQGYADGLGGVAEKNLMEVAIGCDSIRNRTWAGAATLWEPISDVVCQQPCQDSCAENCSSGSCFQECTGALCCQNAAECRSSVIRCMQKTDNWIVGNCFDCCTRVPKSPQAKGTFHWWMGSKCMKGIKWLNGSVRFGKNMAYLHSLQQRKNSLVKPQPPAIAR